jgi:hypothetical protein
MSGIGSISQSGLQGISKASSQIGKSAATLATWGHDHDGVTISPNDNAQTSIVEEVVKVQEAMVQFDASARLVKMEKELTGSILNLIG